MNRFFLISLVTLVALCPRNVVADEKQTNVEGTARFIVFAPGGPLLIELQMTIDGEPFRRARARLIDDLLEQADVDGDGKPTWVEAMINPRFAFGRFAGQAQQQQLAKTYDRNGNGQVEAAEVEYLLSRFSGGQGSEAFSLTRGNSGTRGPDVLKLLDTDNDKQLSAEELQAATERLKSRDADDNDVLDAIELTAAVGGAARYQIVRRGGATAATGDIPARLLSARTEDIDRLYKELLTRYGGKNKKLDTTDLAARPELANALDANNDGRIDLVEIEALKSLPASLVLEAHFGKTGKRPRGLILKSMAKSLGPREKTVSRSGEVTTLRLPGMKLQLSAATSGGASIRNFDQFASQTVARMDTNKNGYVEKKELTNFRQMLPQFQAWDADGDEKVYAKEIAAFYLRRQAPQMSRIAVGVQDLGLSIFSTLDADGDGRIGLREMRRAAERLRSFDKNNDGVITIEEIPRTVSIRISRGGTGYAPYRVSAFGRLQTTSPPPEGAGPAWFVRMDRNLDGDVTLREFLGTAEQFKKLDVDGDDFITREEAKNAAKAEQ